MVTEEIQNLIERYPDAAKLVELAAHYEENHPYYILCEVLLGVIDKVMLTSKEVTNGDSTNV
ncbi:MAG TPA: hypothetical protein VH815_10315 [Acidobacteriota bacterium]|jgi:hypothetical protein